MNIYNDNDPKVCAWASELVRAGHVAPGTVLCKSIKEVQADELRQANQVHLFAGILGWPLALQLAGWGDRPVWTGSCPCQPFSAAGKRKGTADERHLWPDMLRLIAECRPATVFGEQVASSDGREWLAGVRIDLEALGYEVGAADLCAAGIGAPHIRQRLFWVADSESRDRGVLLQQRRPEQASAQLGGGREGSGLGLTPSVRPQGQQQARAASGAVERTRFAGWDNYTIIPCGDGKARRIVTRLSLLADGVSHTMASTHSANDETELDDAAQAQSRSSQKVRLLPSQDAAQAIPQRLGGHGEVYVAEILRSPLYGRMARGADQGRNAKEQQAAIIQEAKEVLRELRFKKAARVASHRRQSAEQCGLQLEDVVRGLPHADALGRMEGDHETAEAVRALLIACASPWLVQHPLQPLSEAWRSVGREAIQRAWQAGLFEGFGLIACAPLVTGFDNRVTALKGMGNAIVPSVAAAFVRAFMETEAV